MDVLDRVATCRFEIVILFSVHNFTVFILYQEESDSLVTAS